MMVNSLECLKIERQVVEVLSTCLPQENRWVGPDSRLVEDLYVDSVTLVEVVLELNEEFGVELAEREVAEWRTVRDMCRSLVVCRSKL